MTTLWEGDCVRHRAAGFVGLHVGYTRLAGLMERSGDLRAVRVQLPDGSIRIASEHNLEKLEASEFANYATSIGVVLKGSRRPAVPKRV